MLNTGRGAFENTDIVGLFGNTPVLIVALTLTKTLVLNRIIMNHTYNVLMMVYDLSTN